MTREQAKAIAYECLITGKVTPEAEDVSFWGKAYEALAKHTEYTRCAECKNGEKQNAWVHCDFHNIFMKPDDSCSRGVRRNDGTITD